MVDPENEKDLTLAQIYYEIDHGQPIKSGEAPVDRETQSPEDLVSHNLVYVLNGPPAPWARVAPDFSNRRLYDTQKNLKLIIGIELSRQHDLRDLYEGPIALDFRFYFQIPAYVKNKEKRKAMIGKPHFIKPDSSNLIKFYEDVSKGILFKDDCQIAQGTWSKIYDEQPRTEFSIRRI